MAFEDSLADMVDKVKQYEDQLATEEATKTAIIMPFIGRVLGYDAFNPTEVVPEYIADLGLKKGEKIDFAVLRDGAVQMLIEAKKIGEPLSLDHAGQLIRYFHTSNARIGVLTNGRSWNFYTDLDRPNRMDEKPFLQLDLANVDPYVLPELTKLTKDAFDLDSVLLAAEELKYVSALKRALGEQFTEPSDDFVKLLALRVYEGSYTQRVRELFTGLVKKSLDQFISDKVNERLKSALGGSAPRVGAAPVAQESEGAAEEVQEVNDGVETTLDELEGFHIIRAICASEVPLSRISMRDSKSYLAILLDDNNRKPICRLHFNRKQRYLGLFDEAKVETREPISSLEELYASADVLRATIHRYL
ncbi:MAG TPA: type I restriction enzyme HsdR N-terminal domain-containing protein [Propioniciclava sp.]|uniref:type I restriction endonuclease n=1 Tax=Propioniciclava sp. TaxID=2038686 RepID=UPI002C038812|nr:restriction endonuclease [Propioniciclava sp.]HRL48847.1 type I restriction enzyme HsdR N-terminal domain-containing protein [Propioniciclava sp.]HRL79510.1 type I restriction enzyme HsdR N-terminal domain-containing protein [Propioniciclava sp.]